MLIQRLTLSLGHANFSLYNASKWTVEGFTEAISKEVKPEWGIKFTLIEPGAFRTDWSGRSMEFAEKRHPAYDHMNTKAHMANRHGNQPGDPVKGAKVFYELAVMEDPPLRCIVGTDAYKLIIQKLESHLESVKKFAELSNSTDVDGYEASN
jgi:NAD(P)-dependent dehydrogenase (short-subunit alcohol dehydrogenase family)